MSKLVVIPRDAAVIEADLLRCARYESIALQTQGPTQASVYYGTVRVKLMKELATTVKACSDCRVAKIGDPLVADPAWSASQHTGPRFLCLACVKEAKREMHSSIFKRHQEFDNDLFRRSPRQPTQMLLDAVPGLLEWARTRS
jgi:hypothetical protein